MAIKQTEQKESMRKKRLVVDPPPHRLFHRPPVCDGILSYGAV